VPEPGEEGAGEPTEVPEPVGKGAGKLLSGGGLESAGNEASGTVGANAEAAGVPAGVPAGEAVGGALAAGAEKVTEAGAEAETEPGKEVGAVAGSDGAPAWLVVTAVGAAAPPAAVGAGSAPVPGGRCGG
jgi:hypothetical protein